MNNEYVLGEVNSEEQMELACDLFLKVTKQMGIELEPMQLYIAFKDFLTEKMLVNISYSLAESVMYRKLYAPQHFQ